jgi:hypothetical protein
VQGPRRTDRNMEKVVRITRRRLEDREKDIRIKTMKWQKNESEIKRVVKNRSRAEFSKVKKHIEERPWKKKLKNNEKVCRLVEKDKIVEKEKKGEYREYLVTDEEPTNLEK